MELYHLRIFERDTGVHAGNDAIARGAVWIRRTDPVDTAIAARRDDDSLSRNTDEIARAHIHSDNAVELVIFLAAHADFKHLALGNEINALCQALLEQRMHHGMASAVFKIRSARMGMAAHLALMEAAILLPVEGITHIVKLVNISTSTFRKVFHGILIAEIVAALDGIKYMRFDRICRVRNRRYTIHTALGHRRSRTRRNELRHDRDLEILVLCCCQSCTHACTTTADDQNIIRDLTSLDLFRNVLAIPREVRASCQYDTGCCRAFYEGTT